MSGEKYYDIVGIVSGVTYEDTASEDVVELMMKADIVTIREKSIRVETTEVTNEGVIRFRGRLVQ